MFPACHGHYWPPATQGIELGDHKQDFAEKPGLTQSFPVVCPLSSEKVGLQDVHSAQEVYQELVERERQDDEWAFNRDAAKATLLQRQAQTLGLKKRAKEAEADADWTEVHVTHCIRDLSMAVEQRRKHGDIEVAKLRMRLQEAHAMRDDARFSQRQQLAETQQLLDLEKAHTAEVEAMLARTKEGLAAQLEKADAYEEEVKQDLLRRDAEVAETAKQMDNRVAVAKQAAARRIQEVEERCARQIAIRREELAKTESICHARQELAREKSNQATEEAAVRRDLAKQRRDAQKGSFERHRLTAEEGCRQMVEKVQRRGEDTALYVQEKLADISLLATPKEDNQEEISKESLAQVVCILGHHHNSRRRYTPTTDARLSKILQGRLHGCEGFASPSPRLLPPPVGLSPRRSEK
mmetsp:Transcript_51698/g.123056  ORF Transcript_51698/g.123056 Transcript_51698/m.123056 type:complete len:410 (+) Transcript_51698:28-1257(+)